MHHHNRNVPRAMHLSSRVLSLMSEKRSELGGIPVNRKKAPTIVDVSFPNGSSIGVRVQRKQTTHAAISLSIQSTFM
jgi:hypothetical protein